MENKSGKYFLTPEESTVFGNHAVRPDETVMAKRNRFFADIDASIQITHLTNGGMLIETA